MSKIETEKIFKYKLTKDQIVEAIKSYYKIEGEVVSISENISHEDDMGMDITTFEGIILTTKSE